MSISSLIKKIPKVKRFISTHNPTDSELIQALGLLNKQNPLVVDVGANTGQTIDLILSINPNTKIYSFEPTPDLVSGLKEKYKGYNTVEIVDIALADKKGELDFFVSEFSPTNSLLQPNTELYSKYNTTLSDTLKNGKVVKIQVDTLDDWFKNKKDTRIIDLMKIDTQGSEYEVLKGSIDNLKMNIRAVILELQYLPFYTNSRPFYDTMKLLYENGFVLFSFFGNNKINNLQLVENNGLFINSSLIKV